MVATETDLLPLMFRVCFDSCDSLDDWRCLEMLMSFELRSLSTLKLLSTVADSVGFEPSALRGIRLGVVDLGFEAGLSVFLRGGSCTAEVSDPAWEGQSSERESNQACSIATPFNQATLSKAHTLRGESTKLWVRLKLLSRLTWESMGDAIVN
jgi:hypothetical protein